MISEGRSEGSDGARRWAGQAPLDALVAALRLGSEPVASAAAGEVGRRFSPLVRKYWRAQQCGEYTDFFQEVMVRLFVALPGLRESGAFPGLFRRIVIGAAADYWRSLEPTVADHRSDAMPAPEAVEESFDEDLITCLIVRTYLEVLPPREREVIEFIYMHDLDVVEVAQAIGVTPGAVRTTKRRALQKLRAVARKM